MLRAFLAGGVIVVAFVLGSPVLAQQDPHFGTWKLNLAKSKSTAGPPPQSSMRTYEPFEGNGIKFTPITVDSTGKKTTGGYSAHFDGKEYPVTGNPNFDTVIIKRIDANTWESTLKKNGKLVQTVTNAVSKDAKTLNTTAKAPDGKIISTGVWDKQ